ncbi:MAG: inorganic phosphate transporter [Paenibacillaceae bacterium]
MFLTVIALIIALFFAMNIGASGTAAAMGSAYGGGAVKNKLFAVSLVAIAALAGAVIGGGEVVKTIGNGLIHTSINVELSVIILASACLTLFYANMVGIPLSTSEVTVGSVVGVGVAYQSVAITKILLIVTIWIALPFVAFVIAFLLAKITPHLDKWLQKTGKPVLVRRVLIIFLIGAGCYEAFSAGMNNVANAVGPLVAADIIKTTTGIWLGGAFVGLGAILLGGRVLETNGKKITKLSLINGSFVSLTSGTLVIIASVFGIPVPLTQATTMAIFGVGIADHGKKLWDNNIVKKIVKVWITSPLSSLVVSYSLVQLFILNNYYTLIVVIAVFIITISFFGFKRLRHHPSMGDGI